MLSARIPVIPTGKCFSVCPTMTNCPDRSRSPMSQMGLTSVRQEWIGILFVADLLDSFIRQDLLDDDHKNPLKITKPRIFTFTHKKLRLNTRSSTEEKLKYLLSALITFNCFKTTHVDLVSSNQSCFVSFFLRRISKFTVKRINNLNYTPRTVIYHLQYK